MIAALHVFLLAVYQLLFTQMQRIRQAVDLLCLIFIGLLFIGTIESTPLDDYVHADDPHFAWTVIRTYDQPDYTLYILNFTSQKWLNGK